MSNDSDNAGNNCDKITLILFINFMDLMSLN